MPRARNIKPSFFTNEDLAELPFETRLLFIGLWTLADREGYLEDRPKRIRMALFPGDNVDVDRALDELQQARFIRRYMVGDGRYIEVCQFTKHQNPHHREPASTIPKPGASPGLAVHESAAKPGAPAGYKGVDARGKPGASPGQDRGEPSARPGLALLIPDSGFLNPEEPPPSDESEGAGEEYPLPTKAATAAAHRAAQRAAFEVWWRGYPRKVSKADAEKAWLKVDPNPDLQATLTKAVAAQCQWDTWKRDGGRYIPHAATWLNARRWEDEADAVAGPGGYDWDEIARMANLNDNEEAAHAPD